MSQKCVVIVMFFGSSDFEICYHVSRFQETWFYSVLEPEREMSFVFSNDLAIRKNRNQARTHYSKCLTMLKWWSQCGDSFCNHRIIGQEWPPIMIWGNVNTEHSVVSTIRTWTWTDGGQYICTSPSFFHWETTTRKICQWNGPQISHRNSVAIVILVVKVLLIYEPIELNLVRITND